MRYSRSSSQYLVTRVLILLLLLQSLPSFAAPSKSFDVPPLLFPAIPTERNSATPRMPEFEADRGKKAEVMKQFNRLPLRFEKNVGQTDAQVKYFSRGPGYSLFLTPTEAVLQLKGASRSTADRGSRVGDLGTRTAETTAGALPAGAIPFGLKSRLKSQDPAIRNPQPATDEPQSANATPPSVVRMKLLNARTSPKIEGVDPMPGKTNYFTGNNPRLWRRNITSYGRVHYRNVYPGIDLIYYGNQQNLEYDFVVASHAKPGDILMQFDGIERMSLDASGDLILHTANGEVRQQKPVIYQMQEGERSSVDGGYVIKDEHTVGFEIGEYDSNRPLIIDPVVAYSTFLGGTGNDTAVKVVVDSQGNAIVAGYTDSADFPTVNALQPQRGGADPNFVAQDLFVLKLNQEGTALLFSTYFGGSEIELPYDLKLDGLGNICLTGETTSKDFPTKNAIQPVSGNAPDSDYFVTDVFVTKLNRDGSSILFSTYLGGRDLDTVRGLAVDGAGNLYVTGTTLSSDFPLQNALQPEFRGTLDAFITKINANGAALVYSTYFGGSLDEEGIGVAVDRSGNAYVLGSTNSADFPTAQPLQPAMNGPIDAFLAKLNPNGTAILYSSYFGGSDVDFGRALALDAFGNVYVGGETLSTDLPLKNPLQGTLRGAQDLYLAKFTPNLNSFSLQFSTYLGGSSGDYLQGITVDRFGRIYLVGGTASPDFPTRDSIQPLPDPLNPKRGILLGFLSVLNSACSGLVYSTFLGGRNEDVAFGISVDAMGNAYVVGNALSEDLPTTPGAFQRRFIGPEILPGFVNSDGFITKIFNRSLHTLDDDDR